MQGRNIRYVHLPRALDPGQAVEEQVGTVLSIRYYNKVLVFSAAWRGFPPQDGEYALWAWRYAARRSSLRSHVATMRIANRHLYIGPVTRLAGLG